jgi:hypothetical protein
LAGADTLGLNPEGPSGASRLAGMSWVTSGPCWSSSARHTDLIWWAERIREWAARGANTLAYLTMTAMPTPSEMRAPFAACAGGHPVTYDYGG